MWYMHDLGWGWWLLMSVGMVAFWALIVYGIVWLARGGPLPARAERAPESPQRILERRLAAGDIDAEEYERLRALLDKEPADGAAAKPPPAPALR